ncbi:hypothetical protein RND81_06G232500 [Saponaria officinalis]|uniref:Uncharacterized protein n=1 Tax=Saponaria officinalis TaxID=3572 RepID=A0AAW1KF10_SAPOF
MDVSDYLSPQFPIDYFAKDEVKDFPSFDHNDERKYVGYDPTEEIEEVKELRFVNCGNSEETQRNAESCEFDASGYFVGYRKYKKSELEKMQCDVAYDVDVENSESSVGVGEIQRNSESCEYDADGYFVGYRKYEKSEFNRVQCGNDFCECRAKTNVDDAKREPSVESEEIQRNPESCEFDASGYFVGYRKYKKSDYLIKMQCLGYLPDEYDAKTKVDYDVADDAKSESSVDLIKRNPYFDYFGYDHDSKLQSEEFEVPKSKAARLEYDSDGFVVGPRETDCETEEVQSNAAAAAACKDCDFDFTENKEQGGEIQEVVCDNFDMLINDVSEGSDHESRTNLKRKRADLKVEQGSRDSKGLLRKRARSL